MNNKHWPLWLLLSILLLILLLTVTVTMTLENRPTMQRFSTTKNNPAPSAEWQQIENQIQQMIANNNLHAAEELLMQALTRYPEKKEVWMQLGIVSYRSGKYAQSEQAFRHVLRQQPNNAAAYNNLSLTLQQMQQPQAAEQAICQAIRLEPKNGEILLNAACFYARSQQDIHALKYLQQAIKNGISPEKVSGYSELVKLLENPDYLKYYQQLQQKDAPHQSH